MHGRNDSALTRPRALFDFLSQRPKSAGSIDNVLDIESLLPLGSAAESRAVFQAIDAGGE